MSTIKLEDRDGNTKFFEVAGTGTEADPFVPAFGGKDANLEIPSGRMAGYSSVNKFGANHEVAANTTEDVWGGGGTYTYPTTADITHLSQAVDQAAMRDKTIFIQGLDANWDLIEQSKNLDATNTTTLVALDTPLIRLFRMRVLANVVGDQDIKVTNSAGTVLYGIMAAGDNKSLMAQYTIPNGKTGYLTQWEVSSVKTTASDPRNIEIRLWTADRDAGYEFELKHASSLNGIGESGFIHTLNPYSKITQKTDIKITVSPTINPADAHAGFDLILEDNPA